MERVLQAEILDELPATDPRAAAARRDLRLLNTLMGNHGPIVSAFNHLENSTIAEIGAGEGLLALALAGKIESPGQLMLIDRQPVVSNETIESIQRLGWKVKVIESDVFEWLERAPKVDAICASLFLHHFDGARLKRLLELSAERADYFAASEPLRDAVALWFAKKIWLIGCNEVTRHDAAISVRAGFKNAELSGMWPAGWRLAEKRHGLFTHFFAAARER